MNTMMLLDNLRRMQASHKTTVVELKDMKDNVEGQVTGIQREKGKKDRIGPLMGGILANTSC